MEKLKNKGKKYAVTFYTMIDYKVKSYGLFGDTGRGFSFSSSRYKGAGGDAYHYFIDNKLVKSDEEFKGGWH